MRAYWRVCPGFWTDEKVRCWDSDTRLLALYLLTSPHRNAEGLFVLPKSYMVSDLQWTKARFTKAFEVLTAHGFLKYDDRVDVCFLVNALEYQSPENPNQVKAAIGQLDNLPKTRLLQDFLKVAETVSPTLAEQLRNPSARVTETVQGTLGEPLALTQAPPPEEDSFPDFWSLYPRKTAKQAAAKSYARLTKKEKALARSAARSMAAQIKKTGMDLQYVPHAATWLNAKRWDEWEGGAIPPGYETRGKDGGDPEFIHPMAANSIEALGYDPFEERPAADITVGPVQVIDRRTGEEVDGPHGTS